MAYFARSLDLIWYTCALVNKITKSLVILSSIAIKMASRSPAKKVRKSNFSASEISVLTEKCQENMEILQSKFSNSITNTKKIVAAVNAVGVSLRTTQEVNDKFQNRQSMGKK